ncbi:4'-phosphopantetheinyl transferase superfamily protein [Streptomyces sp. RKND-216]|uniref:4'-phosphopantetheinyl transferase family protein n=1 Tax=Streptomyces sp. RKND-216 TaxID=2562581 RepID=UPI00109DE0BA|nr:4'-phosphopantetheinyl transferase superfamily protein [Streptomyces sp. RKND-216]THA24090.1 4'-phosphopantetheinyl transferase superfamily protein [Streptomyces sp. RKND-216]
MTVWLCPNEALPPPTADILALHWLDPDEWAAGERLRREQDRRQYRTARVLVRRALALETGIPEAELVIVRSPLGRPRLRLPESVAPRGRAAFDFNLSHTEGMNALALARPGRVGVDVERVSRTATGQGSAAIAAMFSDEECSGLRALEEGRTRDRATTRLWSLKEAYVKARGTGIGLPFDSFAFALDETGHVVGFRPPEDDVESRWRFRVFDAGPDVVAAVAVERRAPGEQAVQVHHGFPWRTYPAHRLRVG